MHIQPCESILQSTNRSSALKFLLLIAFFLLTYTRTHTQHNTTQRNTTQHNATQHNTTQHNTTHTHTHTLTLMLKLFKQCYCLKHNYFHF